MGIKDVFFEQWIKRNASLRVHFYDFRFFCGGADGIQ